MKNNSKIILLNIFIAILLAAPAYIYAAGLVPCDGPKCTFGDFITLVQRVVNFAISVGIALSALVFAWAGWLYMSSGGDEGKIKEAHGLFIKVLWGFLFALGAYLIVQLIASSLGAKTDFVKI